MSKSLFSLFLTSVLLLSFTACKEEAGLEVLPAPGTGTIGDNITPPSIPTPPPPPPAGCDSTSIGLSQTTINGGTPFNGGSDYLSLGQTIPITSTIEVKSIDMHLYATHESLTATLAVIPYSGSGDPDLGATAVGEASVTDFTGRIGFSQRGWVNFEFDTPITLEAGSYYLHLSTDANETNGENISVWGDGYVGSDPIPGGKTFRKNSYGFWHSFDNDRGFRLHVCD